MADTTIQVKKSLTGWKVKIALGAIGLVVIVILSFLYRAELGLITLAIGLGYAGKLVIQVRHQYKLARYEERRIEAEVKKLEASSFFVETNTGVFFLENSMVSINSFYPAVSASKTLADVPMLLPETTTPKYRKLLEVDFIHLLVVGPSGSGKTTVLCHLIDNAPSNTVIYALDPHAQFNEWPNRVNEIVGNGRNYQAINSKLDSLISTMDKRYNGTETTSQKILIVADEWLGILDKCPNAKDFFNTIGSEARKVNMSLVISSISATVDDLDVSGAIRDNLAQLTLSRTLKAQNLGEIKWSKKDTELVELPGKYYPKYQLPARVETVEEFEALPILDDGPKAFAPSSEELKCYELHLQGASLRKISTEVYGSVGGRQVEEVKQVLSKFGVSV